ncbi:MAG: hypothetical protein J6Y08_00065 [Clostridiales bacterium]|nr:hypothetical protein [Clostridiales bacterium]
MGSSDAGNVVALKESQRRGFMNRNMIKYLVIVFMVMDHIADCFGGYMPGLTYNSLRFFGRLVAPTMAFFIAEGYMHTRDVKKYRRRIGILALISWLPCIFCFMGIEVIKKAPYLLVAQSIIASFYLGLVALSVWYSDKFKKGMKIFFIVLLCIASIITDMPVVGVLAPLFHVTFKDHRVKRYIAVAIPYIFFFSLMCTSSWWYCLGLFLTPLLLIFCYNGESGRKSAFHKWFFYVFYPSHLVILGIIKWFIVK